MGYTEVTENEANVSSAYIRTISKALTARVPYKDIKFLVTNQIESLIRNKETAKRIKGIVFSKFEPQNDEGLKPT